MSVNLWLSRSQSAAVVHAGGDVSGLSLGTMCCRPPWQQMADRMLIESCGSERYPCGPKERCSVCSGGRVDGGQSCLQPYHGGVVAESLDLVGPCGISHDSGHEDRIDRPRLWGVPTRWVASGVPQRSVRDPRLVLGSARGLLTTEHEQALIEQPGEREQPGRESDPRPGVAEVGDPGDAATWPVSMLAAA